LAQFARDLEREKTVRFVRESMSNRLNDERSAIVVIMQRLHEGDVSGDILSREANYYHLMIPRSGFESQSHQSRGLDRRDPQTGEPITPVRPLDSVISPPRLTAHTEANDAACAEASCSTIPQKWLAASTLA
jgi:hypothetical protein